MYPLGVESSIYMDLYTAMFAAVITFVQHKYFESNSTVCTVSNSTENPSESHDKDYSWWKEQKYK